VLEHLARALGARQARELNLARVELGDLGDEGFDERIDLVLEIIHGETGPRTGGSSR
jgi:hypothetical protein